MRKKFTMLLASLFLTLGTAWAYQFSYDKTTWTVPATNHEKVTTVPDEVFTVYNTNYSDAAELDANKVGVYAEEVTVTGSTVTVTLVYTSGNGSNIRLDICGVDLVAADGSVMYKDYHFGWAGTNPSNNTYTLSEVVEGSYTLRVFVASQKEDFTNASNNSRGNMTVTGASHLIVGSTAENKIFYHIKNVRSNKYANYEGANIQFTQITEPALGSYWYLMEVADAQNVPDGYKAYRLYNAANALAVENPASGNMTANEGVTYPAKVYCIGTHTNGGYTGVVLRPLNGDASSWNDAGGSGEKIGTYSYDDPGSIWEFEKVNVTEAQLIQNAVAAKTTVVNTLTTEATNTQRYYYGYELSVLEEKKAEIEAISVSQTSLVDALTSAITISKVSSFAGLERIAPKAGDKFIMDNKGRDGRLTAFAAGTDVKCLAESSPFPYFDAVWTLVATGTEGQFKLYNEKLKVYVGVLSDANNTKFQYASEAENAGVYELANVEGYATFKKVGGDNNSHLHQSSWGGKEIVRWDNGDASQWQLAKAFGPELTTDANNPICYALKSGRDGNYYFTLDNNKVKLFNNKSIATEVTTHWYFMLDNSGNLKMYSKSDNKAMGYLTGNSGNTKLTNDESTEGYDNSTYTLYFAPYNQTNYNGAWFALKPSRGDTYVSNHGGTGNYMGFHTAFDDGGTRIAFESVDRMRLEAKVAECEAKVVGDAIGYYSVSGGDAAAVLAEAKAALQGNSNEAYRSSLAALNALTYTLNIPETGKYYRLKNKSSNNYISGNETTITLLAAGENVASTIFYLGEDKSLRSIISGKYLDCNAKSYSDDAKSGEFGVAYNGCEENVITYKNNGYWTYGAGNDGGTLDRGSSAPNNIGYNWYVEEVDMTSVTIRYMYKGAELTDLSVEKLVELGSTYTVANPYANKYVNVTCAVNGNRVEPVDGQWTVNVTEPTSVIVTITEDLPFKISKDFATANWQYLQMNSSAWKYMQKNENDNNTSSVSVSNLTDRALWAFVGDALNGFKILNKGAEGAVLTVDETGDGTAAYMKASGDQKWTIEKGNGGFIIRQGANECLNDYAGGGVMKIWKADASPTGAGSAFRTISASVTDLADLCFPGVFTLQAERSPLLYDASANVADANKLSSGMASGIAANGNDANQQFLISESETDGLYYLYSVGAAKFVDAELNFTDCPEPVLAFEPNAGNPVFPWFVKIGGKYVAPGSGGTEGNKIHHLASVNNDDGKRYRIEKVGEDMSLTTSVALTIQYAEDLIKEASQLSNSKVYAVYTYDRGAWYHNGDDALWSTGKTAKPGNAAENADHFAFLTVNGKIYLYSVGAGKFIVKSEAQHDGMYYAAYSDTPAQTVELLAATNGGWFPVVVKLNAPSAPSQLAISNSYDYPVVMYDKLSDTGNQVRIEEIGTLDLSAVVAQIEAYQLDEEAKGGLQTLITEATTKNAYLENASLTAAITAAQAALDKVGATYDELMTAKENLAAALNSALYVTEANGFSNNYVYTFVSKRGWMGADNTDGVISGTGADDNTNYQWAVYKSTREHYYLYNIGKTQFMGVETRNNTQMPFSVTPQTTGLTFKKSAWADYPIMFSMDNQNVVNNNKDGQMICWTGGWDNLKDEGSNHKVTVVGKIESSTLSTIAAAVELYETQGVAVQALDAAIAAAQAKVDGIGNGLGYYSTTEVDAAATLAAIVEFKNAITGETTVAAIEAKTAAANALVETFSVNLPEAGKFYRFSYDYGTAGVKYVQAVASNVSGKANAMVMTDEQGTASIFYFADGKLLSYSAGQYVHDAGNTRGLQPVGSTGGAAKFEAGSVAGKLYIFAGDSFHANKSGDICFIDHCGEGHPDKGAGDEHNFIVEEVDVLPVTVTSAQVDFNGETKCVSTLFTPVALEVPAGITAYIGVNEDNYLAMKPIEGEGEDAAIIPANTGVILMANEANTYEFSISAAAGAAIEDGANIITGTVAKTVITPDANTTCYVLAKDAQDGVGLYKALKNKTESGAAGNTSFINNACKAYIPVSVAEPQAAQALAFRFRGKEQGTTEMDMPMANGQQPAAIYDLTGRRIEKIVEKGIYIVNGKKVVIK